MLAPKEIQLIFNCSNKAVFRLTIAILVFSVPMARLKQLAIRSPYQKINTRASLNYRRQRLSIIWEYRWKIGSKRPLKIEQASAQEYRQNISEAGLCEQTNRMFEILKPKKTLLFEMGATSRATAINKTSKFSVKLVSCSAKHCCLKAVLFFDISYVMFSWR